MRDKTRDLLTAVFIVVIALAATACFGQTPESGKAKFNKAQADIDSTVTSSLTL
jgi:hypothetical protein